MTNYAKLDHANRRIIMDRTFARRAEIVGSSEYEMLQEARNAYPKYKVVQKRIRVNMKQERYQGLTYAYMEDYILTHEAPETVKETLNEFVEMRLISECHSKPFRYPVIKQWFLNRYPEIMQFGMPKGHKEKEKAVQVSQEEAKEEQKVNPAA